MKKSLSEAMKNAMVETLNVLCSESTDIKISKYELFQMAREKSDEWVKYSEINSAEIESIITEFCNENDYIVTSEMIYSNDKKYNQFKIVTEKFEQQSVPLNIQSRGRIAIPAVAVKALGYKPGDNVEIAKVAMNDTNDICYLIGKPEEAFLDTVYDINTITATVDDKNRIRFTVGNDIVNPVYSANNKFIQVF